MVLFFRFSFFLVSVIVISFFLVFLSQASYFSHNRLFLDFNFFFTFLVPFQTFLVFSLAYVLDYTGSLPASFSLQIVHRIVSYRYLLTSDNESPPCVL